MPLKQVAHRCKSSSKNLDPPTSVSSPSGVSMDQSVPQPIESLGVSAVETPLGSSSPSSVSKKSRPTLGKVPCSLSGPSRRSTRSKMISSYSVSHLPEKSMLPSSTVAGASETLPMSPPISVSVTTPSLTPVVDSSVSVQNLTSQSTAPVTVPIPVVPSESPLHVPVFQQDAVSMSTKSVPTPEPECLAHPPPASPIPPPVQTSVLPRVSPRIKQSSATVSSKSKAECPSKPSVSSEHAPKMSKSKRKSSSGLNSPLSKKSKYKSPVSPALSPAASVIPYFLDATKASNYQKWFALRDLWSETQVHLPDFPDLVVLLKTRHWSRTVTHLQSPHPTLIREFYANLDKSILDRKADNCLTAYIRGCHFPFAPSTIARVLKIPKILNPDYSKAFSPDMVLLGKTLTGQPDFIWEEGTELSVSKLTVFYRVLHRIALYNWYPNSHLSSITLDIGRFLFAVGTGVSIDLPTLIFDRILDVASAKGTRNKLPFPCLIQKLIQSVNPPLTPHDFQVSVPSLTKSFLLSTQRRSSQHQQSTSQDPRSAPPIFRGLSDSSWQVQMFTQFQAFQK